MPEVSSDAPVLIHVSREAPALSDLTMHESILRLHRPCHHERLESSRQRCGLGRRRCRNSGSTVGLLAVGGGVQVVCQHEATKDVIRGLEPHGVLSKSLVNLLINLYPAHPISLSLLWILQDWQKLE